MPGKVLFVNRTLIIIFDWLSYNYMCDDLEKKCFIFENVRFAEEVKKENLACM